MNGLANLIACTGRWEGRNRVQVSADEPANESPSTLIVTSMLRDTFVRFDHTWSWKDEPQSGSMLIGYEAKSDSAHVHWIDTWHNGTKVMALTGAFDPQGRLIVLGHFAVQSGPDWGWRIEIQLRGQQLDIDMFCVQPHGKDDGGAWANFTRS